MDILGHISGKDEREKKGQEANTQHEKQVGTVLPQSTEVLHVLELRAEDSAAGSEATKQWEDHRAELRHGNRAQQDNPGIDQE